jgi:cytosine/adenosine deaminase-related metal-dependent hydrolase
MAPVTRLTGARVALSATRTERIDLTIRGNRFLPFDTVVHDVELDLSGHLLLPGLINAHDHLEFNLFPRLGRGPYPNASAWAADIYRPDQSPIEEHLRVPKKIRLLWGGIKNLLSGATTVAHHNPYEPSIFGRGFPVRVLKCFGWAHSLAFSPDLVESFRRTPVRWPFILHAAEGTDAQAQREIARLQELGVLSRRTVLVHAVATGPGDLAAIMEHGSSIVWCPSSNLFTLGRTLSPAVGHTALGTDSALTGAGDLIDEIACARAQSALSAALSDDDIYSLVTANAARMLRIDAGQGSIRERGVADLIAVIDRGQTPAETLAGLCPELVMVSGRTMLVSGRFAKRCDVSGLHPIQVEGRGRWLIRADVPRLYDAATQALGPEIRLAGRRICQ